MTQPSPMLPLWKNVFVFVALMTLLAVTVAGHFLHWGIVAALGVASVKALLVALYFMHLRWSSRTIQIAACAGLFWIAILFSLSLSDYLTRGWIPLSGK